MSAIQEALKDLRSLEKLNNSLKFCNKNSLIEVKEILNKVSAIGDVLKQHNSELKTQNYEIEKLISLLDTAYYKERISRKILKWNFDHCVDLIHFQIIRNLLTQLEINI